MYKEELVNHHRVIKVLEKDLNFVRDYEADKEVVDEEYNE
jgi:hypothetical protein